MKVLVRFADGLAVAMMVLGGVALFALLFHIVLDVFLKAVFNQPIPATLEIVSYYYMVAIAFLPVAYVQKNREHISVDLFTMGFGARGLALIDAIVSVITIAYTATLTWLVYGKAVKAFSEGRNAGCRLFRAADLAGAMDAALRPSAQCAWSFCTRPSSIFVMQRRGRASRRMSATTHTRLRKHKAANSAVEYRER